MNSRHRSMILTVALVAGLLAAPARADVNLCLNCCGNTELIYQCYETELTCDDIEIGPIIRDCDQLSLAGGGSGGFGPGVVDGLHPDVDGQSVLGRPSFDGTATGPSGSLSDFVVLWETRDTFETGRRAQVVARDASGALFWSEFDVAGTERRSDADLVITGTPAGEEVQGAFDLAPTGRIASGDMTVTVTVVVVNDPPTAKATVLDVLHTDVLFDDLQWTFLSSEPIANDRSSWGTLKSGYRD